MKFQFENSMAKHFNKIFGKSINISESEVSVTNIYNTDDYIIYNGDLCAIDNNKQIIGFYKYTIKCYLVACPEEATYFFEEDLHFKNPMV